MTVSKEMASSWLGKLHELDWLLRSCDGAVLSVTDADVIAGNTSGAGPSVKYDLLNYESRKMFLLSCDIPVTRNLY